MDVCCEPATNMIDLRQSPQVSSVEAQALNGTASPRFPKEQVEA